MRRPWIVSRYVTNHLFLEGCLEPFTVFACGVTLSYKTALLQLCWYCLPNSMYFYSAHVVVVSKYCMEMKTVAYFESFWFFSVTYGSSYSELWGGGVELSPNLPAPTSEESEQSTGNKRPRPQRVESPSLPLNVKEPPVGTGSGRIRRALRKEVEKKPRLDTLRSSHGCCSAWIFNGT